MTLYLSCFLAVFTTLCLMEPHWSKMCLSDKLYSAGGMVLVSLVWPLFAWLCIYEELDAIRSKL